MDGIVFQSETGEKNLGGANVFIQWKGTSECLDFYCECGDQFHVCGNMFVYALKCSSCGSIYEMPSSVALKKVEATTALIHVCEPEKEFSALTAPR